MSRQAIHAVQRIVARDGFNPVFLPRLVSLLQDRRLKADAREALVAFGGPAIPILVHFLNDTGESIFVRRALPRVLAMMQDEEVTESLLQALSRSEDAFLRGQLVEALAARLGEDPFQDQRLMQAVEWEARRYLMRLADLQALAEPGELAFAGPVVRLDRRGLSLLVQMICERLEDHLKTMFGLLSLLIPAADAWAAYRSLVSGDAHERAHALEYLDNTLAGTLRRAVFAVIDDAPLAMKLERAERTLALRRVSRVEAVERLLDDGMEGDDDARALAVAGLYTLYSERMEPLYGLVPRVRAVSRDPLIRETADWVSAQLARVQGEH